MDNASGALVVAPTRKGGSMRRLHRVIGPIFALALALAVAGGAAADAHQARYSVPFTLTPAQCPGLQTTVTGSGEYFTVTNTRTDAAGVTHLEVNQLATGTATDTQGGTYHFNYHNHSSVTIPPGGLAEVRSNDHFNLEGTGSASGLHVGFVETFRSVGPGQPQLDLVYINVRGNPDCDPI